MKRSVVRALKRSRHFPNKLGNKARREGSCQLEIRRILNFPIKDGTMRVEALASFGLFIHKPFALRDAAETG
jgi:hypothetical protein